MSSLDNFTADFAMQCPPPLGLLPTSKITPVVGNPDTSESNVVLNLENEVDQLASALAARFEELTLIHDLSQSMTLGDTSESIIPLLLRELRACTSSRSLAIILEPDELVNHDTALHLDGWPVEEDWLNQIIAQTEQGSPIDPGVTISVAIANQVPMPDGGRIHIIVVPIHRRNQLLGRMIAIRTDQQNEFGTTEADLMRSTSMMLGVHLLNQRQFVELQQMYEGAIGSLVSALDAKDTYTSGHSERVSQLTVELATRLGYDEAGISRVRMAGILHDIGKIGVDDAVLNKPGKLTDEEFEQIKQHPVLGYEILKGIRQFSDLLPAVRHHHESWDGSGYPDGLAGDAIPRDAQIMAVADAFDAMTSDRPYRPGMCLEKVITIFQSGRGTQWAADVVDTLLGMPAVMQQYARKESDQTSPNS